jgi:DNA polymerase III delta subunit
MAPSSSTAAPTELPVYLVRGDDPVLTGDAVRQLVADLVGDDDPAFAVEDLAGDDYEMAAVIEAAQTPPFFGDRRVVVARAVGRFSAQDVAPLISYLADPLPSTARRWRRPDRTRPPRCREEGRPRGRRRRPVRW